MHDAPPPTTNISLKDGDPGEYAPSNFDKYRV